MDKIKKLEHRYNAIINRLQDMSSLAASWNPLLFKSEDELGLALTWTAIIDLNEGASISKTKINSLVKAWCRAAPINKQIDIETDLFKDTGHYFVERTFAEHGFRLYQKGNYTRLNNFKTVFSNQNISILEAPTDSVRIDGIDIMRGTNDTPTTYIIERRPGSMEQYTFHAMWPLLRDSLSYTADNKHLDLERVLSKEDSVKLRQYLVVAYNDVFEKWVTHNAPNPYIPYFKSISSDENVLRKGFELFINFDLPLEQLDSVFVKLPDESIILNHEITY